MLYRIIGYIFKDNVPYRINQNMVVSGYDEVDKLCKDNGYEYYLYTLIPVK